MPTTIMLSSGQTVYSDTDVSRLRSQLQGPAASVPAFVDVEENGRVVTLGSAHIVRVDEREPVSGDLRVI